MHNCIIWGLLTPWAKLAEQTAQYLILILNIVDKVINASVTHPL